MIRLLRGRCDRCGRRLLLRCSCRRCQAEVLEEAEQRQLVARIEAAYGPGGQA